MLVKFHGHVNTQALTSLFSEAPASRVLAQLGAKVVGATQSSTHPEKNFLTINKINCTLSLQTEHQDQPTTITITIE